MSTRKTKNNLLKIFSNAGVLGVTLAATKANAGGGGGGGGAGGYGSTGMNQADMEAAVADAAEGLPPGSYEADVDGDGVADFDVDVSDYPSTPFLAVWNGEKYVHENDFLFGKPNTVFANYKTGLKAYEKGIGGDTYLLSETLHAHDGQLKLQIRELEPEESYIDKFEVCALDLKANEHFVADGNLEDSCVFDTNETKTLEGTMHQYHAKQNTFTVATGAYTSLKPQEGESMTMLTGDELVIRVPKVQLESGKDVYVLVDSHYRDWTLGNQVPFSRLERFMIQSMSLGRSSVTTLAGVALLASVVFVGLNKTDSDVLAKLLSVPHSYADYTIGGPIGRSLVISAGDSFGQTYLQTLFPRYVQATQEVVRIPREVIAKLKDEFLTLRIKATKKHKVRTAFLFQGTAHTPNMETLSVQNVTNSKTGTDYSEQIKSKNGIFLHTTPGDVLDVVIKDLPKVADTTRRYVLRANGFYTRMSTKTAAMVGKNWLERLAPEDRTLLKDLRLS